MLDVIRLTVGKNPAAYLVEGQLHEQRYMAQYFELHTPYDFCGYGDTQQDARDTLAALLAASEEAGLLGQEGGR